jgi:hypothetical protein
MQAFAGAARPVAGAVDRMVGAGVSQGSRVQLIRHSPSTMGDPILQGKRPAKKYWT